MNSDKFLDKTILIALSGTGGHIFPALSLGAHLGKYAKIVYICDKRSSEFLQAQQLENYQTIEMQGFRNTSLLHWLKLPLSLGRALWQSMRILRGHKPFAVLCCGGYVSLPVGLAAILASRKLYLLEQNSIMGTANRLLTRFAEQTFLGLPLLDSTARAVLVGNPMEDKLLAYRQKKLQDISSQQQEDGGKIRILITGGSQGALHMSLALVGIFANYPLFSDRFSLWHQTGKLHYDAISEAYNNKKLEVKLSAFIDDMAEGYEWCDMQIARAGAMSVSEAQATSTPTIFVPFPYAVDNHQEYNAQFLLQKNACWLVQQAKMKVILPKILEMVHLNPQVLIDMSDRLASLDLPDSKELIAQVVFDS